MSRDDGRVSTRAAKLKSSQVSPRNISMPNNPSIDDVEQQGYYQLKSLSNAAKPFFDCVSLFAANINGSDPNQAVLYYNSEFQTLLTSDGLAAIKGLQKHGIKVQISFLGNHENAGWAAKMTIAGAQNLANQLVNMCIQFGFDGINIDDEYSAYGANGDPQSFYNVCNMIQSNPKFKGKVLTKCLYADSQYFTSSTSVAKLLNEGYDMTYSGNVGALTPYNQDYGMSKTSLYLGVNPSINGGDIVQALSQAVKDARYAGMMVYPTNSWSATGDAAAYYTSIAKGQYGPDATVTFQAPKLRGSASKKTTSKAKVASAAKSSAKFTKTSLKSTKTGKVNK